MSRPVASLTSEQSLQRLRQALGEDCLSQSESDLEAYGRDETEDLEYRPDLVARPRSTDQIVDLLRVAHREGIPITPRGAGTGLSGGALAVRGGICLSLERLNRIVAIDRGDMVAEVQAGVVTGDLMRSAAEEGLLYGPNPSSFDQCTLGGNIAENAAGPLSLRYGTTRAQVLGLEVVTAEGELLRTGGRNRKDVAGYDLTSLFVGSEGTLGVVTAATLRLHPAPRARTTLLAAFPTLEAAARAVEVLCREVPSLAACEIMDGPAIAAVAAIQTVPDSLRQAGAALLLELHHDRPRAPETLAEEVFERLEPLGLEDLQVALDAADARMLWQIRRQVAHGVKAQSVYKEVDTVVPRSRLAELVRAAREVATAEGLEAICYGHAGDGNLHINLLRGALDDPHWARARDRAETALFGRAVALGGSITGEHGVGWTQRHHLDRLADPVGLERMRRLKAVLDPRGILNPGKIFLSGPEEAS